MPWSATVVVLAGLVRAAAIRSRNRPRPRTLCGDQIAQPPKLPQVSRAHAFA